MKSAGQKEDKVQKGDKNREYESGMSSKYNKSTTRSRMRRKFLFRINVKLAIQGN